MVYNNTKSDEQKGFLAHEFYNLMNLVTYI
jgi:hypothetical protein